MPRSFHAIAVVALVLVLAGCAPPWAAKNEGIYVVGADGIGLVRVEDAVAEPAWSPDGTRLAFTTEDGLFVVNAAGSNRVRLAESTEGASAPAWSPDGTRIAFVAPEERLLYVVVVDGSATKAVPLLDDDPGEALVAFPVDNVPTWSPNGRRLAFVSWDGNGDEVYAVNPDGSGRARLSNIPASLEPVNPADPRGQKKAVSDAGTPAWSPDGTRIAFALHPETHGAPGGIYLISANGSRRSRLTAVAPFTAPAWSPEGTTILFSAQRGSQTDVYLLRAQGRTVTDLAYSIVSGVWQNLRADAPPRRWRLSNLTRHNIRPAVDPAWSPDGTRIAFSYDGDIYIMNADGMRKTRVAATDMEDVAPGWSPDGSKIAFSSYDPVFDDAVFGG